VPSIEADHRRLAVILAADVASYSRLMSDDEEATLKTLASYREVIAGLAAEHSGRIFGAAGDSIMIEFASAIQSVRCAVAIQRATGRRNADLPDTRRMVFRIGINVGDVIAHDADLFGDGVNIAARLQALAEPGRICITESVHEHISGKLSFACRFIGERKVKNIPRAVRFYDVDPSLEAPVPVRSLERGTLALPDKPSIAVLPFTNMSGDPAQDYFADGLTEDLTTALAKFRWFFVIARNSSFIYKHRPATVQQVGRDLGVRYVLEGSARKQGHRVRVVAQLVEAETGHHVWADRYDRNGVDLFEIQDEIVDRVAGAIEPEMLRSETVRARHMTAASLTAWELVFRGMWHFYQVKQSDHQKARGFFRNAIEAAPDIAEGHAWLARCNAGLLFYGWSDSREADADEGWKAALDAVRLAPADPYAQYAVGMMNIVTGRPNAAMDAAQRAIDLSPSFALGYLALGLGRLFSGRAQQALEPLHRGLRLSPFDPQAFIWLQFLAFAHLLAGHSSEALDRARDAVAKRPASFSAHCVLACSAVEVGQLEEARQAIAQMHEALAPHPNQLSAFLDRFANDDQRAQILKDLQKAGWQV
jgi:adenylate cyclase